MEIKFIKHIAVTIIFFSTQCTIADKKNDCDEIIKRVTEIQINNYHNEYSKEIIKSIYHSSCPRINIFKMLGIVYFTLEEFDSAFANFQKVVNTIDSNDVFSNFKMSEIYFRHNKYDSSKKYLSKVVSLRNKVRGFAVEVNPIYLNPEEQLFSVDISRVIFLYAVSLYNLKELEKALWYFNLCESWQYNLSETQQYILQIEATKRKP